jgi:large subunit ribosomal protein L10
LVLSKSQKVDLGNEYSDVLNNSSGMMVFDYSGLSVAAFEELRNKVREKGAKMRVVKNRVLIHAINDRPYSQMNEHLEGPTCVIFAGDDPVSPAKTLLDFTKDHDFITIKCGMANDTYLNGAQAIELAKIPSQEILYAKILGGIKAPATNLLGMIKGMNNKLHGLMKAYIEKLENQA